MNTQQLESFLAVAENLSFARAAEVLNITQSAVSRQIHSLEDELGAKLFHRTSRIVTLTPAGISFFEDAKSFMAGLRIATAKIQRHTKANVQILTIGCNNEVACQPLTPLLEICRQKHPQIHPSLRVIPHRSILNLFFQGELDILFGFRDDASSREGVSYLELYKTPVCCVISSSHPYAQKPEIDEQELYSENIIMCDSYSIPSKAAILQNHMEQHFTLDSIYYCDNLNAMLALVKAGYGFGILPQPDTDDPDICYIPFSGKETISFGVFYKEGSENPLVKEFLSVLKQFTKSLNNA